MAEFTISASQLTQKKDELERLKNTFEKQINQLRSESGKMNTMWEGEAKEEFARNLEKKIEMLVSFLGILAEFIGALLRIIEAYKKVEEKNKQLASS